MNCNAVGNGASGDLRDGADVRNSPMAVDVVDLRTFYASPLGKVARRFVSRMVRARWPSCTGLAFLGIGYATPYLGSFRDEAMRLIAFMPAEQGVINWPQSGLSSSALIEPGMLPLPDSSIDRIVIVHALETVDHPRELLAEAWRILTPGGRLIAVVPSRRGVWARFDGTPFGYGQPFSKSQLRELLRETLFSPIHWAEALYMPPFQRRPFLSSAAAFERIGASLSLPFAGVHLVEATKQLYRPVLARKGNRRPVPHMQPAVVRVAGRAGDRGPPMPGGSDANVRWRARHPLRASA
jgi:SAM-dependent methyltransferase